MPFLGNTARHIPKNVHYLSRGQSVPESVLLIADRRVIECSVVGVMDLVLEVDGPRGLIFLASEEFVDCGFPSTIGANDPE